MKRIICISIVFITLFSCFHTAGAEETRTVKSAIEWNLRTFQEFREFRDIVGSDGKARHLYRLTYPRIKVLNNGDWIFFFQEGQVATEIFYMKSKDGGKTWSEPKFLAENRLFRVIQEHSPPLTHVSFKTDG